LYRPCVFAALRTLRIASDWQCYWLNGVLPRELLQLRCAGSSGLFMSAGSMWSAVHGSLGRAPSLHIQHCVALSLTIFAALR